MNDFRSNLIDVECDFVHETAKAIKVRSHVGGKVVWVPLSACEVTRKGKGDLVVLTLPEPMATEKGLI